ncbi:MAG: DNA recombination protein RmuC [Candidatus Omnitrophica bacterium]|nr:DNA recombination protein RmuC [Candidatus Omnitrophota bacterium]
MPVIALSVLCVVFAVVFLVIISRQNSRIEELLRSARDQFLSDRTKDAVDQESRRQALEGAVRSLEVRLKDYESLLRQWEADRERKFGQLEQELTSAAQATVRLQETTGKLSNVLGNVKLRGQWGERMAEDIISFSGLLENVSYIKQTAQASSATRPDFIFLLPNGERVNMDVKFPLDNYLKMSNASTDIEREAAKKEFLKNVRARISEIKGREYINPHENTLDFVLLFIPNEQVFALIHELEPGIMDEALKEKVVLCSPFTLYAMLAVIRQAHENFRFEKDVKKILSHIDLFVKHFETFKVRFEDVGALIAKLDQKYAELRDVSFKNIDTKVRHIEEYKKGSLPENEDSSLLP